jgi:uncharacterized protein YggE
MILAGLITVAMALAACAPAVFNERGRTRPANRCNGNGVVYVVPDLAYINVGVHSTGDSVGEAMDANKAQATAIKDTLVAQGVAEGDIQTSSFNVYPQSDYDFQGAVTATISRWITPFT